MPYREFYASRVDQVLATDWPGSLHGAEFVDFYSDLSLGIPLETASVDTVIAADVLEHIYRPHDLLTEIHRVLKPGGCALLNIPFLYWVHEAPHDYYRYTQFALRRMAEDNGFEVSSLRTFGGRAYILADVLGKLIQRTPVIGALTARLMQRAVLALLGPQRQSATFPLMMGLVLRRPESQS